MKIVVTGANRGLGLEFVRQSAARGDEVVAACRMPDEAAALRDLAGSTAGRVTVLRCDVADDASVAAFAAAVGAGAVDVVINNAGVAGSWAGLADVDMELALRIYSVNALGPLRVTRALLGNLRKGSGKRVASVSSGLASIADNTSGGAYAYRLSKAALNMAAKTLAAALASDGIVSVALNPGWVKTDMGGANAPTAIVDSVRGMVGRIDALTLADGGRFVHWSGADSAW